MDAGFLAQHKSKHLLAHLLAAAGAQRWPRALRGESGETPTGFYADFGLEAPPDAATCEQLADDMARLLATTQVFRDVRLSPGEARRRFAGQAWKLKQVAVLAEWEQPVDCYELDGFIDVCDCTLKSPRELRAIHPERFVLTGASPVEWSDRGVTHRLIRISGDLFPLPPPCGCCTVSLPSD